MRLANVEPTPKVTNRAGRAQQNKVLVEVRKVKKVSVRWFIFVRFLFLWTLRHTLNL